MTDPLLLAQIRKIIYDAMNAREEHRIKSNRHVEDDVPHLNSWDLSTEVALEILKLIK